MIEHLPKDEIFIRRLNEIIQTNIGKETFNIKELALELGISLYSLNRRFFAITNKTCKNYIRETRLKKAFQMLQNEEFKASEVAYKVGFSSPAYFTKCFHEFYGYPPGKISKGVLKTNEELNSALITEYPKKKARLSKTFFILTSGIFFLAFLVFLVSNFFIKNPYSNKGIPTNNQRKSIAVLPFMNLSDTLSNQHFIDGLTEEILTNLSKINDLRIISPTSIEQISRSEKSVIEIGRKLKVNYILDGSGQKYGKRFALRVQLIEVSSDRDIWAETYEEEIRENNDIFEIQARIAQSIASELRARITNDEKLQIK